MTNASYRPVGAWIHQVPHRIVFVEPFQNVLRECVGFPVDNVRVGGGGYGHDRESSFAAL